MHLTAAAFSLFDPALAIDLGLSSMKGWSSGAHVHENQQQQQKRRKDVAADLCKLEAFIRDCEQLLPPPLMRVVEVSMADLVGHAKQL